MWSSCCIHKYSSHMHTEKTQYTYCSDGPILYVSSRIGIQIQFTTIYTRFGVQIKHGLKSLPSVVCLTLCVCSCSACRRSSRTWSRRYSSTTASCVLRLKTCSRSSGKWRMPEHTQKACMNRSLRCRTCSRRSYRSQFSQHVLSLLHISGTSSNRHFR